MLPMRFHAKNSRTVRQNTNCEQITIKKLDSVFQTKLFSPLESVSATASGT
jgi:hypothetical protein